LAANSIFFRLFDEFPPRGSLSRNGPSQSHWPIDHRKR
jgi:hypothetical protein